MKEARIKVVMLEAGKEAYVKEIGNSLESMQKIVGGLIEPFYPFDEQVCIVCNEEGKLLGLPLNRAVRDHDGEIMDIIAGAAFICDCSGEDFGSLTEEQQKRYQKMFSEPEVFVMLNGRIIAIPLCE